MKTGLKYHENKSFYENRKSDAQMGIYLNNRQHTPPAKMSYSRYADGIEAHTPFLVRGAVQLDDGKPSQLTGNAVSAANYDKRQRPEDGNDSDRINKDDRKFHPVLQRNKSGMNEKRYQRGDYSSQEYGVLYSSVPKKERS